MCPRVRVNTQIFNPKKVKKRKPIYRFLEKVKIEFADPEDPEDIIWKLP